jgi:integral membrane protein (TIGR01906 family)
MRALERNTNIPFETARPAHEDVMDYLLGKKDHLGPFLEKASERNHMADVKALIECGKKTLIVTLILFIAMFFMLLRSSNRVYIFRRGFIITSLLLLIPIIVTLALLSGGFANFFNEFHKPFFSGESWLFPQDARIILLYPLPFFEELFFRIAGAYTALTALVIMVSIGILLAKYTKSKT